jgi:dienelactone hydrolase
VRGTDSLIALLSGALAVMTCHASGESQTTAAEQRIPVNVFAGEPRGPYQTGTVEELWIDTERDESTTSDPSDKRHLMVQIWYPATFRGDPQRASYVLNRELYPKDEEARWMDDAAAVRTTSVLNAPLAAEPSRFPVLIYNPGGYHPHFSATFQTEFLASHGYVVVSVGHTGLTRIERFPDGYFYRLDRDDPFLSDAQSAGLSDLERFRLEVKWRSERLMPQHIQDIRYVLDRLQTLNATRGHRFHQRLDLDRVASLGWSLGGALSLQASRDEPRIKAAINLDGWLYTDVPETGTHKPIMQIHGDGSLFLSEAGHDPEARLLALAAETRSWELYSRTTADWYDLTLKRATHGHFSDRTLFEPIDASLMHPRLAHDIINRFTLQFLDKYLREAAQTPLLSGAQSYPETELLQGSPK